MKPMRLSDLEALCAKIRAYNGAHPGRGPDPVIDFYFHADAVDPIPTNDVFPTFVLNGDDMPMVDHLAGIGGDHYSVPVVYVKNGERLWQR